MVDYLAPLSAGVLAWTNTSPSQASGLADIWFLVDLSKTLLPHAVCPSVSQWRQ